MNFSLIVHIINRHIKKCVTRKRNEKNFKFSLHVNLINFLLPRLRLLLVINTKNSSNKKKSYKANLIYELQNNRCCKTEN